MKYIVRLTLDETYEIEAENEVSAVDQAWEDMLDEGSWESEVTEKE